MTSQPPVAVRLTSGRNKSLGISYLLCIPFGAFGAHQFYLGRPGRGLLYLFTAGLFFFGWFADLVTLPNQVRQVNTYGF